MGHNVILGTCRLEPACNNTVSNIVGRILTRPTNSHEHLQTIKYLKYKHLTTRDLFFAFEYCISGAGPPHPSPTGRHRPVCLIPAVNKYPIMKEIFMNADYYVLEICSKKCYIYDDKICSHYTALPVKNKQNQIRSWFQKENVDKLKLINLTFTEIKNDILEIKEELTKPIIIVSHYVSTDKGSRYELKCWLEEICKTYNILFIDPIKEMKLKDNNFNIDKYFIKEEDLNHLNKEGETMMKLIFNEHFNKLNCN